MLTVIKLGGSLYHSTLLPYWLAALSLAAESETLLIVPGGGPFADSVRKAQQAHDFADSAAHQMAILAMRQFALMLGALCPAAQFFSDAGQTITGPGLYLWLPDDTALMTADLPQNWQVTADSLALWLAQQQRAARLLLIKSGAPPSPKITDLIDDGLLDEYFIAQYQRQPLPCSIVRQTDFADFLNCQMPLQ